MWKNFETYSNTKNLCRYGSTGLAHCAECVWSTNQGWAMILWEYWNELTEQFFRTLHNKCIFNINWTQMLHSENNYFLFNSFIWYFTLLAKTPINRVERSNVSKIIVRESIQVERPVEMFTNNLCTYCREHDTFPVFNWDILLWGSW